MEGQELKPIAAGMAGADDSVPLSPCPLFPLSSFRAWWGLVILSFQRQARARQMVWIALALLLIAVMQVALARASDRWGMTHWRMPRGVGPTYQEWLLKTQAAAILGYLLGGREITR